MLHAHLLVGPHMEMVVEEGVASGGGGEEEGGVDSGGEGAVEEGVWQ